MSRPTVEEVMSRQLVAVLEHTTFKEVVRLLVGDHVDLLPVVDAARRVVGVVTTSDLLARFGARFHARSHHKHGVTAAELMTAPAIVTTPHADLEDAARLAVHERVHAMPVVDRFGVLLGTVTLTQLASMFLRADEDIACDVRHEIALRPSAAGSASVSVTDGVVTLSGSVSDGASARRLLDAARRLPGVVDVRDDLDHNLDDPLLPARR